MKNVLILVLLLVNGVAWAREYRSVGLKERVANSDVIAIIQIESEGNEYSFEPGMRQLYSVGKVVRVLSGDVSQDRVNLITAGFTPEFNPQCCVVGKEYLVFAARGYSILDSSQLNDLVFVAREKVKFISSADGPYGVFEVSDGRVLGWARSGKPEKIERVIKEIHRARSTASSTAR